jgi:D-lyxose ketol-isomerase
MRNFLQSVIFIVFLSSNSGVCAMNFSQKVTLEIIQETQDEFFAKITYTNNGTQDIYVSPYFPSLRVFDGEVQIPDNGRPMEKMKALALEDYTKLKPGESTYLIEKITKWFLLEKGKKYTAEVSAGYKDPINNIYYPADSVHINFSIY